MATDLDVKNAEAQFAKGVAANTGLDPLVLMAWAEAEGAYAKGGTGGYNFLNVRPKGTGGSWSGVPLAGISSGGFQQFRNVGDAITEVSHWINTMPNYAGVRAAKGAGPKVQIAAIAASPWDVSHYDGGKNLVRAYAGVVGLGKNFMDGIGDAIKGGAGDVAGSLPGVDAAKDTAASVHMMADSVAATVRTITNPHLWLRGGYVIFGGMLIMMGTVLLARSVGAVPTGSSDSLGGQAAQLAGEVTPSGRMARAATKAAGGNPRTSRQGVRREYERVRPLDDPAPAPRRTSSSQDAGGVPF